MQVLSLIWGILAIIGFAIAFLPCLGSLNWLNIPFAGIGLIISVIAYKKAESQSKGQALTGIICCVIAVVLGMFRLIMGGGIA